MAELASLPNAGGIGSGKQVTVHAVASVDLKIRLPVSLQCGNLQTTYVFDDPPASKLSVPSQIQAAIDAYVAARKKTQHISFHP
jgi:hypothetical protein